MKLIFVCEFPLDKSMWHRTFTECAPKMGFEYKGIYSTDLLDSDFIEPNEFLDADYVFVYAANYGSPTHHPTWNWVELPKFVRQFVKPPTKLGVLYDWTEFEMCGDKYPIGMFESMNMADVVFNGSPYSSWFPRINKPHHYLVEPKFQLPHELKRKIDGNVALIRHTPQQSNAFHSIENVVGNKGKFTYFHSGWASAPELPHITFDNANIIWSMPLLNYLNELSNCYIAIDDNEYYYGWSRFGYECAMMGVPVIGTQRTASNTFFFPELVTEHKDYDKQKELVQKLYSDPNWRNHLSIVGNIRMKEHLEPVRCVRRLFDGFESI